MNILEKNLPIKYKYSSAYHYNIFYEKFIFECIAFVILQILI